MTEKRFTVNDGLRDVLCWEINDKENEDMTCGECVKLLNELHNENKKLKQSRAEMLRELRIYRMIASCNNCKYQNYDWFDDGDEFEICEKGNNDQQIEYHICKEWREI
ncbi:MAG: hypothetical protein IKF82_00580 [Bacilli bacterium]|nr:hypothetical protein [Bacilli bacterium]